MMYSTNFDLSASSILSYFDTAAVKGFKIFIEYRKDLEKQEGCGVVAHERLTEPRFTFE